MTRGHLLRRLAIVVSPLVLGITIEGSVSADTFEASYLPAGVQAPVGITTYETFDNLTFNGTSLVTNFNGSPYTGTYTGALNLLNANEYGGAGGTGLYAQSYTGYTLTLSSPVNYFGLWFSALDNGNNLDFYSNNVLVYDFTPALFSSLVGTCPGSSFCGNPNNGEDPGEQFAYLNFYDPTGTFNKVIFSESIPGDAFESDNHAVGLLSSSPGGTPITSTPEPASFLLLGIGCVSLAALKIRQSPTS